MSAVSVRKLSIRFGGIRVIEGLDLDIQESEFLVLLGPSGCGKSTLLNAIAGLIDVSAGQIFIDGRNVTWAEPKDRGIGMVFQSYALYPRMTVAGNLAFGLKVARLPKAEIDRRIKAAVDMLKIGNLLDRRPSELSGGQRQRVAIGRALVREAPVFLFDEPLSNLDAQLRAELRVETKRLHQRLGATMIYVTHDQIEALTLADRIAVMKDGVIQQLDAPQTVHLKPANRFVAGFVGSPAMNFLPGRLTANGAGPQFEAEGIRLPLGRYPFLGHAEAGLPIELGVRPEHIVVNPETDLIGPLAATVEMVEPMGADTLVWCRLGGMPLSVRVASDMVVRAGETLPLGFAPDRLSLFDAESGARL